MSDNRDSDRSSSIDRAEDHRDVSTNEKLAVGDSDVQVGDNLIEDRGDNLGRTVVLRDVLYNNDGQIKSLKESQSYTTTY